MKNSSLIFKLYKVKLYDLCTQTIGIMIEEQDKGSRIKAYKHDSLHSNGSSTYFTYNCFLCQLNIYFVSKKTKSKDSQNSTVGNK